MERLPHALTDLGIVLLLLAGVFAFRAPRRARVGNGAAAFAILGSIILVLTRNPICRPGTVAAAAIVGSLAGWLSASRAKMTGIPSIVAFQHGAGGIAAFLVSSVELLRGVTGVARAAGILGLVVGAGTFSASFIASAKLAGRLKGAPTSLKHHGVLVGVCCAAIAALAAIVAATSASAPVLTLLVATSATLGVVISIRVGGADMPVLISFLNATAGLAAAFCGITVGSRLLVACGATVAASGSVLTQIMCRGMNRGLLSLVVQRTGVCGAAAEESRTAAAAAVLSAARAFDAPVGEQHAQAKRLTSTEAVAGAADVGEAPDTAPHEGTVGDGVARDGFEESVAVARDAMRVIVVPGYGMALADAQSEVVELADKLSAFGKDVKFAMHPVAGRMPGHMHVLLAEAEADYEKMIPLETINPRFSDADLVVIVGACDVVNPAATTRSGTPISGMPILKAHEAKRVIVCNLDRKPGYSGVENPLYDMPGTILLLGDAKESLRRVIDGLG